MKDLSFGLVAAIVILGVFAAFIPDHPLSSHRTQAAAQHRSL